MTVQEYNQATMQYYGITGDAKGRIIEILVTRRDGKTVSEQTTGKKYRSMADAMFGLEMKNAHLSRRS